MVSNRRVDMCSRCGVVPIQSDIPGDYCPDCAKKDFEAREAKERERRLIWLLAAQLGTPSDTSIPETINELIKHHISRIGK